MKTGIDLIEIDRVRQAFNRSGQKLINLLFTAYEKNNLSDIHEQLDRAAGYWAVKEAAVKALGTGFREGILFHHIEIQYDELGAPKLELTGNFKCLMQQKKLTSHNVSISHSKHYAIAIVNLW